MPSRPVDPEQLAFECAVLVAHEWRYLGNKRWVHAGWTDTLTREEAVAWVRDNPDNTWLDRLKRKRDP